MSDHLGYERRDPVGRGTGNSRKGATANTVRIDISDRAITSNPEIA